MTWQRIQTLYLGIATALIAAMFFCRFATIIGPDGAEEFIRYYEKMPFLVLLIMLTSAHVAAIGCYKAFFLQARVCMIAGLLALGFQIWLGVDFLRYHNEMIFSITMSSGLMYDDVLEDCLRFSSNGDFTLIGCIKKSRSSS